MLSEGRAPAAPTSGASAPLGLSSQRNLDVDKILILDFGSQVTQLIARRLRETGVYCELHPHDVDADFVRAFNPRGVILSGSHASVTENETARAPQVVSVVVGRACPQYSALSDRDRRPEDWRAFRVARRRHGGNGE